MNSASVWDRFTKVKGTEPPRGPSTPNILKGNQSLDRPEGRPEAKAMGDW